jgi:hypothetical protein
MFKAARDTPCHLCPGRFFAGQKGINAHTRLKHRADPPSTSAPASAPTPVDPEAENLTEILRKLRKQSRIIPQLPPAVRIPIATKLTKLVTECATSNSTNAWTRLLTFPYNVLVSVSPKQQLGTSPISLTAQIRQNLAEWCNPTLGGRLLSAQPKPKAACGIQKDSDFRRARHVERKVYYGNIRGGVRVFASTEDLAPFNPETLAELQLKHPPAQGELVIPEAPPEAPLSTSVPELSRVIRCFPCDSAGGPDGLRPDYLKNLITKATGTAGTQLLEALTRLTNLILAGRVPKEICPVLYDASLVALKKKDGGIRPIAVGSVLRRIVGKLASQSVMDDLRPVL